VTRLWIDLTTTFEERGRHAHGTTRVERSIVRAFADQPALTHSFVAFDRARGHFVPLAREAVLAILAVPVRPDRQRDRAGRWRRRFWALPVHVRHLFRVPSAMAQGSSDPFAAGDTILFSGEHSRHDFPRLTALKREKRLHFAFVLFDLLQVLENGDPRLDDPEAADLPQTDFMVREAALILPISHFSSAELHRHLVRRGLPGPPITPIRLAGALPGTGPGRAVPGFVPGRFVLCVGDVVERKNHALLLRIWRHLPQAPPLAIVGRIDMEGNALIDAVRSNRSLRDRLRFLPNLDDEALLWLYRNCRFTVFASRLEGFGLPVAESLAYGKPCIASSAAAIPEAGQGCAISLDPDDDAAWCEAVQRLADDKTVQAEAARVAANFRLISWQNTVDDIIYGLVAIKHPLVR
jgi:glycosyltransferase involved in cell wall biosynthesis